MTSIDEIDNWEQSLSQGIIPDDLTELTGGSMPEPPRMPEALSEITILANQKCNFACRYCYSANGRSKDELPENLFNTIVEWFVTRERLLKSGDDQLSVTFSGGGDPMLSFEKIKYLIKGLKAKAKEVSVPLKVGLVCNGSLIKEADAKFLSEHVDDIVISFDVIEDVHNAQRSHYDTVARTIRDLCSKGMRIGLRSTITALNVNRMCEMVKTLDNDFRGCRSIAMEAVLAPVMWKDAESLKEFYSAFVENYFAARRLGEALGISVGNTIDYASESLKSRSCPGKLSVSPDGTLTACSRVATPGDKFFGDFTFGHIAEGTFQIDDRKYARIMNVRADNISRCHSCFARFQCGGGCMLARLSYNSEYMEEYCIFIRSMLINSLMYELD